MWTVVFSWWMGCSRTAEPCADSVQLTDWFTVETGVSAGLNGTSLVGGEGYAVGAGGAAVRTTDGGETWGAVGEAGTSDLMAVVAEASGAVAVGAGGAAVSISGFTATSLSLGTDADLRAVALDGDQVWVVGDGVAVSGALAGPFSVVAAPSLHGVTRVEGVTWVVGDEGAIWRGASFEGLEQVPSGVTSTLRDVVFASATEGVAVGDGGAVLHTSDGATWTPTLGVEGDLLSVAYAKGTYWATGAEGKLLRSIDGGVSWVALFDAEVPLASVDLFEDLSMPNTQIIAVGEGGVAAVYGTYSVPDTGSEWQPCE